MPSKKPRIRLYADENIPIPTVTHLRRKGIAVQHAYDINFINKDDRLHFNKSKFLSRILLSFDKDFKKFKGASLKNHPGILLITVGNNTPEHINKVLDKILKNITTDFIKHAIVRATIDKLVQEKNNNIIEKKI